MGEEYAKRIPTELEITILQHIADEDEDSQSRWSALVQCALVCKAWTEHVRRHLYYAINMNKLRGSLQFESLRQYAHLQPFVRDFKWPRTESWASLYRFNTRDADVIKEIAPAVTKLQFRRVNHRSLQPPLKEAISTFANIKELDMTWSIFEDWTTVTRVISGFPFLTKLALPRTAAFEEDDPKISYPPPSCLVYIKLAFGCEAETVSWIRKGSPIPSIQTVEAESLIDPTVLAKLLRSLGGSLQHLIIHIDSQLGGNISNVPASCYRLTENIALESIKVICTWGSISRGTYGPAITNRDMYRSVITNLIGSICSPHLWSVNLILVSEVGEVEYFPWGVVNNLTKASPHMLQRVDVALRLLINPNSNWGIASHLSSDKYEAYFCQVRSALPELDKKVNMSVISQEDSSDAISSCDDGGYEGEWDNDCSYPYQDYESSPESAESEWDDDGMTVPKSYILRTRW